jgi:predicted nucleic acid-binding protein
MGNYILNLSPSLTDTISRRKSIYLDTNVWIRLAEAKDELASATKLKLLQLCSRELIFCPLSAPTIWELRKQQGSSLDRTTELMEELSLNVTFRFVYDIFDKEIDNFIVYILYDNYESLSVNDIYAPLLGYLSKGYSIAFPEEFPKGEVSKFSDHICGVVERMSLMYLLKMIGDKPPRERDIPPAFSQENIERRKLAKGSKSRMRRIAQENVVKNFILPRLNKKRSLLTIEKQLYFVERMKQLPRSKKYGSALEYILPSMPALNSYAEVSTVCGYDINRNDSMNDFYDKEIMFYGLAYSNVFVSIDKWVKDLMRNHVDSSLRARVTYFATLREFKSYLDKMYADV